MSSRARSNGGRRVVVSQGRGGSSLSDRFSQIKPKTYQTSVNARQTATANNRFSAVMASRTGRAPTNLPRSTRGGRGAGRGSILRTSGGLRTSGSMQRGGFRSGRVPTTPTRARGGRAATVSAAAAGRGRRGGSGGRGGRGARGGRGGRGGGRGGKRENVSKEELDNDLDSYMQSTRNFLDDEMDQYQAERTK